MKTLLTLIAVFLFAASASAQPRPGAFTTVNATAVSPAAICAGCPIGSTSPAVNSGVTAAALVLPISAPANTTNTLYQGVSGLFFGSATSFPIGGLLTVNGFGTHTIGASGTGGNTLTIRNPTAGTGNYGALFVANDSNPTQTQLISLSSTYTNAAPNLAGGSTLAGTGVGGLSVATSDPAASIRFYSGGTVAERARIWPSGGVSIGNVVDPGATNLSVTGILSAATSSITTGNFTTVGTGTINASGTITGANLSTGGILTVSGAGSNLSGTTTITTLGVTGATTLSGSTSIPGGVSGGPIVATSYGMTTWPTTASAANAQVANGDVIRLSISLRAAKHDIEPISLFDARRTVMGLQSVLYRSSVDEDQRQWAGFIADDVEKVNPTLAVYDGRGALQSVTYDRVAAYLLRLVQDQEQRIQALEEALKAK